MSQFKLNAAMVMLTMALFLVALKINDLLFAHLEFAPGINWIYLPAGVRLLATLMFGEAGAIGLLFISCSLMFALASPFLHHLWFALYEHKDHLGASYLAMATGDFFGTLVVLYVAKFLLWCFARRPA
jgi:hypothetical protein